MGLELLLLLLAIAVFGLGLLASLGLVLVQAWLMTVPEKLFRLWLRLRLPWLARRLSLLAPSWDPAGSMRAEFRGCAVELEVKDALLRGGSSFASAQYLLTVRATSAVTEMPRRWLALQSACPIALGSSGPSTVQRLLRPEGAGDAEGAELSGLTTRQDGLSRWIAPRESTRTAIHQLSSNVRVMVEFIRLLEDEAFMVRLEAAALRSSEAWMRRWALRTLLRLEPLADITQGVLMHLADDADSAVRLEALKAMGEKGIDGLRHLATDPEEADEIRAEALRVWTASVRPPKSEEVVGLLPGAPTGTAVVLLQSLGASEDPTFEAPILAMLKRTDAGVIRAVAKALGTLGGTRSAQALGAMVDQEPADAETKRAISSALIQIRSRIAGSSSGRLSLSGVESDEAGRLSEPTTIGALSDPRSRSENTGEVRQRAGEVQQGPN